jgi:hypothetical protein
MNREGYYDEKGKWSVKEEPITGVDPIEFQNVPTEGFVLNKKAGGGSSGWNHRQTYCRVYDPRGWEFEINIPNLLYILQECSAYKGKGLEGEFVYSWDGKDLVLLPVSSPDYKECKVFTDLQSQKIGKKDLVEGCTYLTSKMEKLVYLGQHKINDNIYYNYTDIESENTGYGRNCKFDKKHVFRTPGVLNEYNPYEFLSSFSRLKSKISDDIDPQFAEYIDELQKSEYYSEPDHLVVEPIEKTDKNNIFDRYGSNYIYRFGNIKSVVDLQNAKRTLNKSRSVEDKWDVSIEKKVKSSSYWGGYDTKYEPEGTFTKDEVQKTYGVLKRVYKNGFKKIV